MLGIIDTNLLYKFKSCIKSHTCVNVCAFSWTVTQKSLQIWCVVTYRCNMLQAGTFIQPESCTTVSQTRNEYILQMLPSTYHLCCGDFYQQQEGDRRIVGRSCHHGKTTFQVGWCEWVMMPPFLLSMSGAVLQRRGQASRHERLSSVVTMLTDLDSHWQLLGVKLQQKRQQNIHRATLSLRGCACQSHVSFSRFW